MVSTQVRRLILVAVFFSGTLLAPRQGEAFICRWLRDAFRPRTTTFLPAATTAYYRPPVQTFMPVTSSIAYSPVVANPCTPCAPQVCQYTPQTSFQSHTVNVPVTSYQPVAGVDAYTGCPVTAYRPVTTMVQQVRQVPVTTYRLACSSPPVVAQQVVTAATCVPCSPAAPSVAAPAAGNGTPAGAQQTFQSQRPAQNGSPTPAESGNNVPDSDNVDMSNARRVGPINGGSSSHNSPQLSNPGNKTAWRADGTQVNFRYVSTAGGQPKAPTSTKWRASRR